MAWLRRWHGWHDGRHHFRASRRLRQRISRKPLSWRRKYPGGGYPSGGGQGPVIMGRARTHSAGTAEIARQSGGDSMSVDEASALENTLLRLRQRYTLHFSLPESEQGKKDPRIEIALADATGRRYAGSEVRFRRVFNNPDASNGSNPVVISRTPASSGNSNPTTSTPSSSDTGQLLRVEDEGGRP